MSEEGQTQEKNRQTEIEPNQVLTPRQARAIGLEVSEDVVEVRIYGARFKDQNPVETRAKQLLKKLHDTLQYRIDHKDIVHCSFISETALPLVIEALKQERAIIQIEAKMRGPETKLRNNMIKALKEEFPDGLFYHIHGNPFQPAGIPDIIGCLNGCYIGIEVKVPGKNESKIQKYVRNLTLRAKGISGVAWSVEDCLDIARRALIPYSPTMD